MFVHFYATSKPLDTTSNTKKRMITISSMVDGANISISKSQLLSPIKDVSYRWEWRQQCPSLFSLLTSQGDEISHFSNPPTFHQLHHITMTTSQQI